MIRILLALLLAAPLAVGQEESGGFGARAVLPVRMFSVDGANPETIARILADQFPDISFSADSDSSTVFARVDGDDSERVQKLINEVALRARDALEERQVKQEEERVEALKAFAEQRRSDDSEALKNGVRLQSFRLAHLPADEAARILHALGFDANANIAAFGTTLMMRGPGTAIDEVTQLLEQVDIAQETNASFEVEAEYYEEAELEEIPVSMLRWQELNETREVDFRRAQAELEGHSRELSQLIRKGTRPGQSEDLMRRLSAVVSEQFQLKLESERHEMKQIRRRLDQIAQRLELQERLAGRIIDQRVAQLIEGQEEAMFEREVEWTKRRDQMLQERAIEIERSRQKMNPLEVQAAVDLFGPKMRSQERKLTQEEVAQRDSLRAQYEALKQQLERFGDLEHEDLDGLTLQNDRMLKEEAKREQPRESQVLEEMEMELQHLRRRERNSGKNLEGNEAEKQALLEQAVKALRRQLDPEGLDDLEPEQQVDDPNVEEVPTGDQPQ